MHTAEKIAAPVTARAAGGERTPAPGRRGGGLAPLPQLPAYGFVLALGLAVVVIPAFPREWFIAVNPATHLPYRIIRGPMSVALFNLAWAFDAWWGVPFAVRCLLFIALAGLVAFALRPPRAIAIERRNPIRPRWMLLAGAFVAGAALFYLLRVPREASMRFGDGASIPGDMENGMIFPAELLACYAFLGVRSLLAQLHAQVSMADAIVVTSALAGGLFLAGLLLFSAKWCRSAGEQGALVLGCLATGASAMFLGYIETTQLEMAAMAWFFAAGAASLKEIPGRAAWRWEVAAIFAASLAFLSHAAGLLLIPSCIVFLMQHFDATWSNFPWRPGRAIDRRRVAAGVLIVAVPYIYLLVEPFFIFRNFGNISGGADNIMFVPFSFDYARPVSPLISYAMFSWWHAFDIASALLIAVPAGIPLLMAAAGKGRLIRRLLSLPEKRILLLIGIAAAASLAVPLLWNHDFGMWGDWNLAAAYLFPLNCFAWTAYLATLRVSPSGFRLRRAAPFIFVQLLFAAGFVMQLL